MTARQPDSVESCHRCQLNVVRNDHQQRVSLLLASTPQRVHEHGMKYTGRPAIESDTMKNASKGALFSGLLFPGLGQIVLGHRLRGAVIVVTVLASLSLFVMKAVENALAIVEQMELQGGPISMQDVTDAANQASATSADITLNLTLIVILFCWVAGTIDAYRLGRKMDLMEEKTTATGT